MSRSSISAGEIIRNILLEDEGVAAITGKVFPVATSSAQLPYILYRRSQLTQSPTKWGQPGADAAIIEVVCYASTYVQSIDLAEAVRAALDHQQGEADGMVMRSCFLTDAEESWQDDAFVQQLTFTIRI